MPVPTFQALICFSASIAMIGYVLAQRHKSTLHWLWLGVLGGIALWTAGTLTRHLAADPAVLPLSQKLAQNGILICSSFWLLAAHAYVRPRGTGVHRGFAAGVMVGTVLLALGVFTNEQHGLFVRDMRFEAFEAGPAAFAGPLFWVLLGWAYLCTLAALAIYLRAAGSMLRRDSRLRGLLLALASAVPPLLSTAYVFQPIPLRYDLTPGGLLASVLLLYLAVSRYHLFESLPVARSAVVQNLEEGVVMASGDGRITAWNPAAAEVAGASPPRVGASLGGWLATLDAAGPGRIVEVTTATVGEDPGSPAGQFAILADRTEAIRLERLARQSQRLEIVGALAAGFAHEINDPLSYVHANLVQVERLGARVEEEAVGPDAELAAELADLRAVARETLEGVARIRRIAEEMRSLSRADHGDFELLDLVDVVRTALRFSRLDVASGGIEIDLSLEAVPPVSGREDRLVQLVLNLLVNARQAVVGVPGARIRIETRRARRAVELVVQDNGPGIPEALRERIFDPFFTTRSPDVGTGLGLAIAFDIARDHAGTLEERAAPGGGACFALRLPPGIGEVARAQGEAGSLR